ncbi:protein kinase [Streptomyces sp. NPDC015130]|uniref:protein kinase n=1 Tax=Streptomyces sp. NPDC015130 TaxID=3364940 RepID=UPI0037025A48
MDDYAGRVLADRYRLPLPPTGTDAGLGPDAYDFAETRAFDTYSGQEVLVRQVPLPEFVDAEVLDGAGGSPQPYGSAGRATRRPAEPVVRRAIEAAQAAAQIPDHPLLDQVFDVFAEAGSLWIVSEVVAARPLSALLAEQPLNPYRAAEIGADVLTALRALHAHGWVHRNITARTVLVCDDGRVVLTGLAVGAAEEALCGYAPVPEPGDDEREFGARYGAGTGSGTGSGFASREFEPDFPLAPEPEFTEVYSADLYEAEVYEETEDEDGDAEEPGEGFEGGYAAVYEEEFEEAEEGSEELAYGTDPDEGPLGEFTADAPASGGYGSAEHGSEGYGSGAYASGVYASEEYGSGAHRSEGYGSGAHAADSAPGFDDGADGAGTDAYGQEPYGADPYGAGARSAPGPRTGAVPPAGAPPPTADVRAARAGAIAAYRAGARAAARLGESGALPGQRPAPTEPPTARNEAPGQDGTPPRAPVPAPAPPPAPVPASGAPEPQWWSQTADDEDDEDDEDDDDATGGSAYGGPRSGPPPRVHLAGNWSDGPHAARDGSGPIPAGGSGPGRGPVLPGSGRPALPAGYTAATPEPARLPVPAGAAGPPERAAVPAQVHRGPTTRLDAERARQTRIAVVGAVTERWAPEQAGPVHENWRLAPPIGPATDLWALGALLYRAVQGHAPYPEESAAELVQLVCAEPPAFAEECGPLRPVVESLLRQDPTERPDFEELRGWLRSLVRSAPEPEAGLGAVPLPSFDETRLPIVRRRGELVRRRRKGAGAGAGRHRHKRGKDPRPEPSAPSAPLATAFHEPGPEVAHQGGYADTRAEFQEEIPQRAPRAPRTPRGPARGAGSPRALGRTLLLAVLLLLGGAVAYAVLFLPGEGEEPGASPRTSAPANGPSATTDRPAEPTDGATAKPSAKPSATPSGKPSTTPPAADPSAPALAAGYTLRQDPEGFRIGVPDGWRRSSVNDAGQVRYTDGDFTMIVVPGRDTVAAHGSDPLEYQNSKERELEPSRVSSWSGTEWTRKVVVGTTVTATGSYWWLDGSGRQVAVRNLALIDDGRYWVVLVIGPKDEHDKVAEIHDEATKAFRPGR